MRNLISAQEVIDLAFAESSNMREDSISATSISVAEIKYIRPAFGAMFPLLGEKYADFTNEYVKPALAYFVKCEIIASIAIDMSNSGVAVANPQYQSAATDKQRQRLYDSEMSKAKTLLDFALEYIATHSEEFPDFSGTAPKKHHRLGGLILGNGGGSRSQSASIAGDAFKAEFDKYIKDMQAISEEVGDLIDSTSELADKADEATKAAAEAVEATNDAIQKAEAVTEKASEAIERANEATTNANEAAEKASEVASTKADTDGYYPAMTVGKAENLVGRGESTEEVFSFRPSAGSLSIEDGSAKITSIKGNSVVYNQLISNGNFSNGTTGWRANSPTKAQLSAQNGELTVTATITPTYFYDIAYSSDVTISFIAGHKYLYIAEINSPYQTNIVLRNPNVIEKGEIKLALKININSWTLCAGIFTGKTITSTTPYCAPQSNFTSFKTGDSYKVRNVMLIDLTQMFGDGNEPTSYEEYYQHKPMNIADEFAYNAGTLVDMRVNKIKSVGDNAFNSELGYARVLGGKEYNIYYLSVEGLYEMFFSRTLEGDKEPIDVVSNPMTFPADGYVWIIGANGEPLYSDNVCICLQHSYPKPVIPFEQDAKDLSFISELFPNGMRSAGNVYDEIRYDKATQKWQKIERVSVRAYEEGDAENSDVTTDGENTNYALANPKPKDLDIDFTPYYEIWDFGTEEAIASEASTPFRADIIYQFNAVDRIRNNSTKIAKLEAKIQSLTLAISALQTNE